MMKICFKGKEKDNNMRQWYKNFDIEMGSTVESMFDVDFDLLKTESYKFRNMIRSIGSLMFWDSVDIDVMDSDLNGVEKQNLSNESVVLNDNGINGGKNNKKVKTQSNIEDKTKNYSLNLILLNSDTVNIVEYVEKSIDKNKKNYNFWKLINNDG